jgi:hypothetical protein
VARYVVLLDFLLNVNISVCFLIKKEKDTWLGHKFGRDALLFVKLMHLSLSSLRLQ